MVKILETRRLAALLDQDRLEKRNQKVKLTARQRLDLLLDKGSFKECDMFKKPRCSDFGMENRKVSIAICF